MKSKKFMLAGLVLLAITMVLLPLSGCKNDSVPPEVEKQEQEDGGGSETDKNDTVPETPKYLVTFDVGGNREATAPASITVESGATLTAEQVPKLSDTSSYQFMGWYLGDTKIEAGYTVREPVTVTARWQGTNLTFTAEGKQSLIILGHDDMQIPDSMYYSTDGSNWYKPEVGTPISFGDGTKLYLRAKSSIGTAEPSGAYLVFHFGTEEKVACSGDIRTLVDYTNPTGADTSNARFCRLFRDCSQLTQAPELPATTLASSCYYQMFSGCTGLTQAPELPAETLAVSCYYEMFYGCTSLTQAPELLAETLANHCYFNMFSGCTSLTQAPELPAETLANHCYSNMFSGCTSLTQAPELPAETLANNCYSYMFFGCTGLTQAPELPAKILTGSCYFGMFSDCTSLTRAPKLEATALAPNCYRAMFIRCTGLTEAPKLPATTLASECYKTMFYGCEELSRVTMLAKTKVNAYNALYNWLDGTAGGGTLYVASGMETDPTITDSLPRGWTVAVATTN